MGLRRDGAENAMNPDYEPGRSRSREDNGKNNEEKHHRISGEKGLNGSRPVPLEKPLSVIINRNDSFENGHYPTPKGAYNHLLDQEFTKKALDAVHGHSVVPTPVSVAHSGPSTSSSVQNTPSFTTPTKTSSRQEQTMKRRNLAEKIDKLREGNRMDTFISQLDFSTPNQICLNVRRYARYDNRNIPEKMRTFIMEGSDSPMATVKRSTVPSSRNVPAEVDGDATDYEDLEENDEGMPSSSTASSSSAQWLVERAEFRVTDAKIGQCIDSADSEIRKLAEKLRMLESVDAEMMEGVMEREEEEGCARLIPWDRTRRRKLVKMEDHLLNALPSTSKEAAALNPPSFCQYALQYLHRTSIMASFHIRKNKRKSIWLNAKELEEEKCRNGVKKKEERERREKRKMERAEKEEEEEEKSDEYEVTDDEDDDIPTSNHSRRSNGAPKEKKKKREERKTSRKESIKGRRNSDCPPPVSRLSSVTSRPSHDGDMDYLIPPFNSTLWLEQFGGDRTSSFTYDKIAVPECRRMEIEEVDVEDTEELEEYSSERMMMTIAMQHHQLEDDERRRFSVNPRGVRGPRIQRGVSRDQREESQESGSRSTPSNRGGSEEGEGSLSVPTPPPPPPVAPSRRATISHPPASQFDFDSIRPVSDYERLSTEPPYEKRHFSR